MYAPILSSIFQVTNEPTMNRETKDFSKFEKNRVNEYKDKQLEAFNNRYISNQQKILQACKQTAPIDIINNIIQIKQNNSASEKQIEIKQGTATTLNPITQQVHIIQKDGPHIKVPYSPEVFIQGKKTNELKSIMEKRSQQNNLFQSLKRSEGSLKNLHNNIHIPDQQSFISSKKIINHPNSLENNHNLTKEAELIRRQKGIDRYNKINGLSEKENSFIQSKKRNEISLKMFNQSLDHKDIIIEHRKKIIPSFQQSYDFPLNVPGNKSQFEPKPYPILQSKIKVLDIKQQIVEKNSQDSKLFDQKTHPQSYDYYRMTEQEKSGNLKMQAKIRIQKPDIFNYQSFSSDTLDDHIQKQIERPESKFQHLKNECQEELNMFKSKKRVQEPGANQAQQPLFQARLKINKSILTSI